MIKDIFVPSKRNTFIPATVYCRDDAKGLLLQVHSFKSDRKEDGRYTAIAKAAYDAGLNVISMDFPGNGESKEDFISYSLTSCLDDMESCYEYMLERYPFRQERMILLGYSMGGRLISLFYERHREFKELVFWASMNERLHLKDRFLKQDLQALKDSSKDGVCDFYDIFEEKEDKISERFVDDLLEMDALAPLKHFDGRALIVQGKKDITIDPENAEKIYDALALCKDKKLLWMKEADHGFGLWDGHLKDNEVLLKETREFLHFIESEE